MKMKDEKQKHNHKLTDLIKVCIFGLLMIAPLLASVSQMLYVTLNKNAKDSYYGETINQSEDVYYNVNNLQLSSYYNFENPFMTTDLISSQQTFIYIDEFSSDTLVLTFTPYRLSFYTNQSGKVILRMHDSTYTYSQTFDLSNTTLQFNFKYLGIINLTDDNLIKIFSYNMFYTIEYNKYSYLDNAFYYGVDQMTKSELFNWTQNTAIYTGVKAMTDNLQIQTPAIAILIVYWFILTIIYIIIDIVLKCFTTVTHMIFRAD